MMAEVDTQMSTELILIRSKSRKRTVALHVEPDGSLRVMAPMRTSVAWINAFIAEKAAWIERRRHIVATRKEAKSFIANGGKVPFMGKDIRLVFLPISNGVIGVTFDEDMATLSMTLPDKDREAEARTELILWYKSQARRVIPQRVAQWVGITGLKPSRVLLSNPKHQWGSCNAKNEIRLNWRLIAADPDLIDYIIVHELCHVRYKSHGMRFWGLVEKILPDAKERRRSLRKWERTYAPSHFP